MLDRLKDPKDRERLKKDITEGIPGWYNHYTAVGGDWCADARQRPRAVRGPDDGPRHRRPKSKGKTPPPDPLDVLFDLLIEEGGSVPTVYAHHTEKDMNLALAQPWCSIGSDGSAYAIEGPLRRGNPHPRNFGTFPRVLGVYVRDRGVLRLEDAVRKMTSLNAAKLGLRDRGLLRAGDVRRRDGLRPGEGDRPLDLHRAVPVQRGDRVRHRQRPGRARPRQAHRRDAGQGTAAKVEGRHPINKKHAAAVGWTSYQSRPHLPDLVAIDRAC